MVTVTLKLTVTAEVVVTLTHMKRRHKLGPKSLFSSSTISEVLYPLPLLHRKLVRAVLRIGVGDTTQHRTILHVDLLLCKG